MKNIIFPFLLLCCSLGAFAQTNQFATAQDSDKASMAVLEDMKAQYLSYKSVEADFVLTIELPEEDAEIQKGMIKKLDDSYHLTMNGQHIISNGKKLWFYQPAANIVQINNVYPDAEEDELLSPQNFLKFYDAGKFIAAPLTVAKEEGQAVRWIELKPVDTESEYFKFRIALDIKKNELRNIKAFSRDGARYTLQISKLVANPTFAPETFIFNVANYPGVEVEDLRVE